MARKLSQSDPALAIEFWLTGFYTHRSQLFAPYKGIGVNVVSFHDPVIDGQDMEDTDLYEWSRRPGFSVFCSDPLNAGEVVNQFYSFRNFDGTVIPLFDSNQELASFTTSSISQIIAKTTTEQGYVQNLGSMLYFADGVGIDMKKWLSTSAFSSINPSTWGLAAPTSTPQIYNKGCWLPKTLFSVHNAILDPNGNVEVVVQTFGAGLSGQTEPLWPTTTASTINDGSVQWENMGPLSVWLPDTSYPVPVVVLDTNGNLELATSTSNNVTDWNNATLYNVGDSVFFGGNFWTAIASNTNMPPSEQYATPTWVLSQNPIATGPTAPAWNTTVGGTTTDNSYTWTNIGPGQLVESFGTSYVYCYRTIYGHLTTASPISINTGAIFGPVAAAITSFYIASNIVVFNGVNNFVPGNVFTVQGLTSPVGQVLNNQSFIVISTDLSHTTFAAVFTYPNSGSVGAPIIDSGSTLDLIATVTGVGTNSPLCNATATITATQITGDIVTIYANQGGAPLSFVPGLQVTFSGVTVASFLNNVQYQIANVDPNGAWFQVVYTIAGGIPNQNLTTDTGTVTFNAVEVYRTSDGGGTFLFCGAVTNPSGSVVVIPYDSGQLIAGSGNDNGNPGLDPWINPGGVTGTISFAHVALTAPSGGGSASFTLVQGAQNIAASSPAGSFSLPAALPLNVTGGNCIIVFINTYDVNSFSVSDSQGNSYTQVNTASLPPDHGTVEGTVFVATGVANGPTTVFLNVVTNSDNNNFYGIQAFEVAGLNGTTDTSNTATRNTGSGGGATFGTGAISTANANDVIFTFIYSDLLTNSGNTVSPPTGWIVPSGGNQVVFAANDGASYQQMATAYQVQTATGPFNPTWGTPSQSKAIGITAAFELQTYSPSDGLIATNYSFAVPPGIAISGIQVTIAAEFSGAGGALTVQLIKNGVLVGSPKFITPTASLSDYVLGGMNDLWGAPWAFSDFNSNYGVQITATIATGGSSGTFQVQNVRTEVFGSTSTTGWVFNDFTPDIDLDILLIAPQNHLNDPPPGAPGSSINNAGTILAYWQGRIWMAVGNFVYFNAGPDCVNGVPEESWPPANRFQFVGPVIGLVPTADGVGLLVYLADRVNAILGGPETISFYATDALSNFGITNPNAIFRDGSIIGQLTTQGQYFELIGGQKNEIGERIADYLLENFNPAKTYVTMHRNGEDVGVFLSNGVDKVIRFGSNISAWSVPAFPLSGAGALRSIETSVGVYSLMLASPVTGVNTSTAFIVPGSGTSVGTGTPWTNPSNITLGSPTSYATISASPAQSLEASKYTFNIPNNAIIQGIEVSVTGKNSVPAPTFTPTGSILITGNPLHGSGTVVFNPLPLHLVSAGDLMLLELWMVNQQTNTLPGVGTIVDSLGNTWTALAPPIQFTDSFGQGELFGVYVCDANTATAARTATVTSVQILSDVITIQCNNTFSLGDVITLHDLSAGNAYNGSSFTVTTASPTQVSGAFIASNYGPTADSGVAAGTWNITVTGSLNPNDGAQFEIFGGWVDAYIGGHSLVAASATSGSGPNTFTELDYSAKQFGVFFEYGTDSSFTFGGTPTLPTQLVFSGTSQTAEYVVNQTTTGNITASVANSGGTAKWVMFRALWNLIPSGVTIAPLNPVVGSETDNLAFGTTNTTVVVGSSTDLWGMPWSTPYAVNNENPCQPFGFTLTPNGSSFNLSISEVNVKVFYQSPANYLLARDINSWGDNGPFGKNAGTPYNDCFITVGSITLSPLGAPMFPLQHVVGYFDAVGTLGTQGTCDNGPSIPNIWILPNEINDTQGIGFQQLPEALPEPPEGQNNPSGSLIAMRWPVNMMNSTNASQFVHHLQVRIEFEAENAPNTIKAISFKENQE